MFVGLAFEDYSNNNNSNNNKGNVYVAATIAKPSKAAEINSLHCHSSSSPDECGTVPSDCQTLDNRLGAASLPLLATSVHTHHHYFIITCTQPES